MQKSWVYILTTNKNTALYIGVTSDLTNRILEHKNGTYPGFTERYNVTKLVYFEEFIDISQTIAREKQIKKWNREWKMELIQKENPELRELEL